MRFNQQKAVYLWWNDKGTGQTIRTMNWKHDACLVVITLLFAVLLYNVTDVFQISRKWVAQPQYLVDSDLYVKKSDLKPDSTNHLMWSANLCDSINQTQVDSKDKFMTAEEFSSNITSLLSINRRDCIASTTKEIIKFEGNRL